MRHRIQSAIYLPFVAHNSLDGTAHLTKWQDWTIYFHWSWSFCLDVMVYFRKCYIMYWEKRKKEKRTGWCWSFMVVNSYFISGHCAIVVLSKEISNEYSICFKQLFGLGVANIMGSFFSAYPTTGDTSARF